MALLKRLKIGDLIIIIILVIISFLPFSMLKTSPIKKANAATIAVISVNNHVIKKIDLAHNQVWTYDKHGKFNTVEVKNHQIHISAANCRDQICVKEGWKNKPGQTIVCLPHKFLIEIKDKGRSKSSNNDNFDHTLVNP